MGDLRGGGSQHHIPLIHMEMPYSTLSSPCTSRPMVTTDLSPKAWLRSPKALRMSGVLLHRPPVTRTP